MFFGATAVCGASPTPLIMTCGSQWRHPAAAKRTQNFRLGVMTLFLLPNVRAVAFAATFAAMAVGCVREKEPEEQVLQKALLVEPNAIRLRRPGSTSSQKVVCRVTNESGHLVEITDIKGTCACAIAEPPSRSALAHGEFVDVVMEVRFPEFGKQDSTITIATNPPDAGARIPVQLVSPKEPIPGCCSFLHKCN